MALDLQPFERYRDLIDDWQAFTEIQEKPLRPTVWTNTLRLSPGELVEFLAAHGIRAVALDWWPEAFRLPLAISPGRVPARPLGLYHVQEEVSLLPVYFLDPQPGERVLDLCAAPGNKTALAAVRMADQGTMVANELNRKRLGLIAQVLSRLGLTNVAVLNHDGSSMPRALGLFDKVMADVPCSCEGTVRKNPEVLYRPARPAGWRRNLQVAVLEKAAQLCKPGGRIVYSTCTYAPEENESVVDEVLRASDGGLELLEARVPQLASVPGLTRWQGESYLPELSRAMRVYPHLNDTGGFFVAVLEKAAAKPAIEPVLPVPLPAAVDVSPYRSELGERFGIPAAVLDNAAVLQTSKKRASLVRASLEIPERPAPWLLGLPFYRTKSERRRRFTNAAALKLGRQATRNVLEINLDQLLELVATRRLAVDADTAARCFTGEGYVLPRYRGFVVTIGLFRPAEDGGGEVWGAVPKHWASLLGTEREAEPNPEES